MAIEYNYSMQFSNLEKRIIEKDKFFYMLMHRDTELAVTTDSSFNSWRILRPSRLPVGLELINVEDFLLQMRKEGRVRNETERDKYRDAAVASNLTFISEWLSNRVLPLSRENAKLLYQAFGLEQKPSKEYKTEIAKRFRAVSITDNFWLKRSDELLHWYQVDVKAIPLSTSLGLFALTGDSDFTLDNVTDIQAAAEMSLHGTYSKGCVRRDDGLYVVKGGSYHDVIAEWLCSQLLGCTNVYGYCNYQLDCGQGKNGFDRTNTYTVFCKVMSNDNRDLVMANTVFGKADEIAVKQFEKQYAQIAVWDYLCGNPDRHGGNWGFFADAPTWEFSGLHDIYDNNKAFSVASYKPSGRHLHGSIVGRGTPQACTLEDGAKKYNSLANLKFIKPVNSEWFKMLGNDWNKYLDEFKERCGILGISLKVL